MRIEYSPETSDGYNPLAIYYPIHSNYVALLACYDRMLTEDERKKGNGITLQATIDTEGKLTEASVIYSEYDNEAFGKCLIDDMKDWVFPKSMTGKAYDVKISNWI